MHACFWRLGLVESCLPWTCTAWSSKSNVDRDFYNLEITPTSAYITSSRILQPLMFRRMVQLTVLIPEGFCLALLFMGFLMDLESRPTKISLEDQIKIRSNLVAIKSHRLSIDAVKFV